MKCDAPSDCCINSFSVHPCQKVQLAFSEITTSCALSLSFCPFFFSPDHSPHLQVQSRCSSKENILRSSESLCHQASFKTHFKRCNSKIYVFFTHVWLLFACLSVRDVLPEVVKPHVKHLKYAVEA